MEQSGSQSKSVEFGWTVATDGYCWGVGQDDVRRRTLNPVGSGHRQYGPMSNPALFRELADVVLGPETDQAILQFAATYGSLTFKDTFGLWMETIRAMREATRVWDQLRNNDAEALQNRMDLRGYEVGPVGHWRGWAPFQIGTNPYASVPTHAKKVACLIYWSGDKPDDGGTALYDDLIREGRSDFHIVEMVPEESNHTTAQYHAGALDVESLIRERVLSPLVNRYLSEGVLQTYLVHDSTTGKSIISLWPQHLLGALWIQLANAICWERSHYKCGGCRKWFEAARRSRAGHDVRFCSTTCRSRAHREKVEAAFHMHEEGKEDREIAKELNVKVGQIREWLNKKKEK